MKVSIPRHYALLLAAALTGLVAFADYSTGKDISVDVYYVFPILLAGWAGGFAVGIGLSLICLALLFLVAAATGHPFSNSFVFYFDASSIFLAFVMAAQLGSLFRKSRDTLQPASTIDALSGIDNRAAFAEALRTEILRQRRVPQPFALAYIDCDKFKPINDRYGHEHGDSLLISVARTLTQSVWKTDTAARLGGDEFAVLLPGMDAEQANVIVQELRKKLTEQMASKNWQVSFSFGIAVYTRPPDSAEDAIGRAEALMYRVKQAGKDGALQEVF